jgi:hypothetical protein
MLRNLHCVFMNSASGQRVNVGVPIRSNVSVTKHVGARSNALKKLKTFYAPLVMVSI